MKKKYYYLTAVISYLVFLLTTIPANIINTVLGEDSPVILQGLSGTLWNGKAYSVSIDNSIKLQQTQWSLSAWKLLSGRVAIQTKTHYQNKLISAEIGSSFLGRVFVNDLRAQLKASDIAKISAIPMAQIDGLISLNIEHAEWKQGELPIASGQVLWKNASITVAETASLGDVNITLSESESGQLKADIKNQGGDINISGSAELSGDENYTVDVQLRPTASASNNIKNSLGFFAQKQKNGQYTLKKNGSLKEIM
jgi:general secretion pathway protein N